MDHEMFIDRVVDEARFASRIRQLVEDMPTRPGSAVVCTSELTPEQVEEARRRNRLVVRFDGIGFALMLGWKKRSAVTV